MTLTEKLEGLKKQRDEALAAVHMIVGAIQLCEQLIKEEAEKPTEAIPPDSP